MRVDRDEFAPRGLEHDSITLILGYLLRIGLQGAYFVVVARSLGVENYGAFSAALALCSLLVPFSSLGAGDLLIKHVRRDSRLAGSQWKSAACVTGASGSFLALSFVLVGHWLAPDSVSWVALLCLGLSDLILARLIEVATQGYLAVGEARKAAALPLWLMGMRLAAAAVLAAGSWHSSPTTWAALYLAGTAPVALVTLHRTTKRMRSSSGVVQRRFRSEWREGIYFSVSVSAQGVYNDIDKAMLGRLSTLEATGIYTAAYRIVDVAFAPLRGLLAAAYPRFFDHQDAGIVATLGFTRRLARPAVALAIVSSAALLLGAGLVPVVLGSEYREAVPALRALSVLPLLKAVHYLAADTLTGAGFQRARTVVQICVAMFNVGANLLLLPVWSWKGAVATSLATDALLGIALWALVAVKSRSERASNSRRGSAETSSSAALGGDQAD
jgi:O-antigen/teichoic acid export membrane protein